MQTVIICILHNIGEQQYFNIKRNNMDVILLYKMGKFYELFDDDADIGVNLLGLNYMGKQQRRHCGMYTTIQLL